MKKSEIVAALADQLELTKKEADTAVDLVFATILEGIQNGEKVAISGFGTFELKTKAERHGRNPKTGEEIIIPAKKAISFKPSKVLKEDIR